MFVGRITLFGASLLTVSLVGLVAADGGPNTTTVVPATANSTPFPQALQSAGPAPLSLRSKLLRPKLYDNTEICTPKVMSLAVGGKSSPPPPLSLRDWFTTAGGLVTGFDFYVVNGGPGAVPNDIHSMQFYDGTARIYLGTLIIDPYPASFSTRSPTPRLSPIPVHRDPVTGEPRMMRVSVDYTVGTYTIVDARTQELLVGPEDIGPDRVPFQLPPGHVGVDLRFTGEASLCAGGSPVCGVVLARGGSGNEDGLHITNATQCIPEAWELVCDNLEWAPTDPPPPAIGEPVPCVGGGVCSLGRPHFGIALTLYTELEDPLPPAIETVSLDQPNPPESCSGEFVMLQDFVGDAGLTKVYPVDLFRCDSDDDIDLVDFGCFQSCFGRSAKHERCWVNDGDLDEDVDVDDYWGFFVCSLFDPHDPLCGTLVETGHRYHDADVYEIVGLRPGQVLSVLLEGATDALGNHLFDPYLRIFQPAEETAEQIAVSDNFNRLNLDAYTTIEVPAGVSSLYVGVSSATFTDYDPLEPPLLPADEDSESGGFQLTLGLTDPECVVDDSSGGPYECYVSKHEPDDTLAQADALGSVCDPTSGCPLNLVGMIGDGAFAETGQDIDLYRVDLTDQLADTRSLVAFVADPRSLGFDTVFDLAMALYDSSGNLVAVGDQQRRGSTGLDDSRPAIVAEVRGAAVGGDGVYYLAVFGTDRGLYDAACNFLGTPIPPTVLNPPHGPDAAGTSESDLRPVVGGRVNEPGGRLTGCTVDPEIEPAEMLQCYTIILLTDTFPVPVYLPDRCDNETGDDSILTACTIPVADRLAAMQPDVLRLGNGKYGVMPGDVDFYSVNADPGDIIAANTSNIAGLSALERQTESVRSYLALFDRDGYVFAEHDYSLESQDFEAFDGISDEIAALIAGEMPGGVGNAAYLMVGIDAGNMLRAENTPIDANVPGTTLSTQFLSELLEPRQYRLGVAVMPRLDGLPGEQRMFVVPKRGLDNFHVSCSLNAPIDRTAICHPPILELDPVTGRSVKIIDGNPFFLPFREPEYFVLQPDEVASSNLLIAWDGEFLWVSEEYCIETLPCSVERYLYMVNPDGPPPIIIYPMGVIFGAPTPESKYTGMTEINGYLYALDNITDTFRYWDKTLEPTPGNGGNMEPQPTNEGDDPRWNDLYGDIGTDGAMLYVGCAWNEIDPDTHEILSTGEYGICTFTPHPDTGDIAFNGKIADPITNTDFEPGPRLGGVECLTGGMIVTSDLNSGIMEYWTGWNLNDPDQFGSVQATELPREYQVVRIAAR